MSDQDRLAATLLNHWYCMTRAEELGLVKRKPNPAKYREKLEGIEKADAKAVKDIIEHFQSTNLKMFTGILSRICYGHINIDAKNPVRTATLAYTVGNLPIERFNQFTPALRVQGQLQEISDAFSMMPPASGSYSSTNLSIDLRVGGKDFFDNLYNTEKFVRDFLAACQKVGLLMQFLEKALTKEQLSDVLSGQLNVVFSAASFSDKLIETTTTGITPEAESTVRTHKALALDDAKYELIETASAKASRELKARIEEALRMRIKKVQDLAVSAGSVIFTFEDAQVPPLNITLDVITDW